MTDRKLTEEQRRCLAVQSETFDEIESLKAQLRVIADDWCSPGTAHVIHGHIVDAEYAAKNGDRDGVNQSLNLARQAIIEECAEYMERPPDLPH